MQMASNHKPYEYPHMQTKITAAGACGPEILSIESIKSSILIWFSCSLHWKASKVSICSCTHNTCVSICVQMQNRQHKTFLNSRNRHRYIQAFVSGWYYHKWSFKTGFYFEKLWVDKNEELIWCMTLTGGCKALTRPFSVPLIFSCSSHYPYTSGKSQTFLKTLTDHLNCHQEASTPAGKLTEMKRCRNKPDYIANIADDNLWKGYFSGLVLHFYKVGGLADN